VASALLSFFGSLGEPLVIIRILSSVRLVRVLAIGRRDIVASDLLRVLRLSWRAVRNHRRWRASCAWLRGRPAGIDEFQPQPLGQPRCRRLTVMSGKIEPRPALKATTKRRAAPAAAPPWGQFGHVTSFLSGRRTWVELEQRGLKKTPEYRNVMLRADRHACWLAGLARLSSPDPALSLSSKEIECIATLSAPQKAA
jgi:hypothetical protein